MNDNDLDIKKLNKRLISIKDRIDELERQSKKRSPEYKNLLAELQLYLNSKYDTWETQKYIINNFWQNAYTRWVDGANLINDHLYAPTKFPFEKMAMESIIKKYVKNKEKALEVGCGKGAMSRVLASQFDFAEGNDLSINQIKENQEQNKISNLSFSSRNIFEIKDEKFDFIYVSDCFTYMNDEEVISFFNAIRELLKDENSILVVRDTVMQVGRWYQKNHWYCTRYRNYKWYMEENALKPYLLKDFRDYSHSVRYLDDYFTVFGEEKRQEIKDKPEILPQIVENWVNDEETCSWFYVYSKAQKNEI